MTNQNIIIRTSFDFCLLSSNFQNWFYKEIKKDDSLIILKELDLTITDVTAGDATAHAANADGRTDANAVGHAARTLTARYAASVAIAIRDAAEAATHWKCYDQAEEEFQKTEKINGLEILNLRTFDKLWISHYDIKALKEVLE